MLMPKKVQSAIITFTSFTTKDRHRHSCIVVSVVMLSWISQFVSAQLGQLLNLIRIKEQTTSFLVELEDGGYILLEEMYYVTVILSSTGKLFITSPAPSCIKYYCTLFTFLYFMLYPSNRFSLPL
jgi:hypothetical protein